MGSLRSSGPWSLVDRRFNRSRYDAEAVVAAFTSRLRQTVDLDAVRRDLVGVTQDAFQPVHVSVWLAPVPVGEAALEALEALELDRPAVLAACVSPRTPRACGFHDHEGFGTATSTKSFMIMKVRRAGAARRWTRAGGGHRSG